VRSRKTFGLFLAALSLWFLCVIVVCVRSYQYPGLHSVFPAYRNAGIAWLQQEQIYGTGKSAFLYSPLIAAFYSPFALISQNVSEVIWRLLLGVALLLSLWFNARALFGFSKKSFAYLLLLILPLALSNLNQGQANLMLMVLVLVATTAALQSQWWMCAFCASLSVYWKIYPVAFALLLATIFPNKLALRMFLALGGLFIISLLLQKPSYVMREYGNWFVHLASDRRRGNEYYGKWRDFYLILRLIGIPISMMWWKIIEAIAGLIAAAICLVGRIRRQSPVTLVFGAMSLAIIWMLLFGPATEAATYFLVAAPCAYLVIFGWCEISETALRTTSTLTYVGFVAADVINSWFHFKEDIYLVHAIQPCFALCFCVALCFWWRRQIAEASRVELLKGD
jgi:Glycosyltransferase family 87